MQTIWYFKYIYLIIAILFNWFGSTICREIALMALPILSIISTLSVIFAVSSALMHAKATMTIVDNSFNNQTGYRNNTKKRRRVETDKFPCRITSMRREDARTTTNMAMRCP